MEGGKVVIKLKILQMWKWDIRVRRVSKIIREQALLLSC